MFVRPFVALLIFGLICLPIRLLFMKLPDGRLRRVMLFNISESFRRTEARK